MIRTFRSGLLLAGATAILTLSLAVAGPVEDSQKLLKDGKYDEAIALLEKADQKQPTIIKGLAQAHMAKADYYMNNDQMPPRVKYTTALQEYRKVLVYDKTSKKAPGQHQDDRGYLQVHAGRPVPQ